VNGLFFPAAAKTASLSKPRVIRGIAAQFIGLVNNNKGVVLALKHLDFNCHLDFDIWNLFRATAKIGR
jgi:hypothetical protein